MNSKYIISILIIAFCLLVGCSKNAELAPDSNPLAQLGEKIYSGDLINPTMEELQAFYGEKYTIIDGDVYLDSIQGLTDLHTFSNVKKIVGEFNIGYNFDLVSLEGLHLDSLVELRIYGNPSLVNLDALRSINIESTLHIEDNNKLSSLEGLSNIESIDSLSIIGNDKLSNLNGLNSLYCVDYLTIANSNITDLSALSNLHTIYSLSLIDNKLTNLNGLDAMQTISLLRIERNEYLTSISALSTLQSFGPFGYLSIQENSKLTNLDGLNNIESISSCLTIYGNPLLTNLEGLNNLNSIGGCTDINNNESLQSLEGLDGLESVSYFRICDNDILMDFCAIKDLVSNRGVDDMFITWENAYNPTEVDIVNGYCILE